MTAYIKWWSEIPKSQTPWWEIFEMSEQIIRSISVAEESVILVALLITFFRLNLFKSWRNFQIEEPVSWAFGNRLKLKSPSKIILVRFIHMWSKVEEHWFKNVILSGGRYIEATRSLWDAIVMSIQAASRELFAFMSWRSYASKYTFCTFLCCHYMTMTWKCHISHFIEDVNKPWQNVRFPFELEHGSKEFNCRGVCLHLTK